MERFEKLVRKTKKKYPGYKFSWEIYTDIILENIARKPYWLDIGAGANIWITEQPGAELSVGLDIEKNPGMILDPTTGGFVIAASETLPFKDDSYEFITSRYTFEHLKSPEKTLREIHRVLKPGGTFVMQTTNKNSPAVLLARLVPFKIKKAILRKLFTEIPSGTYRAYYKINSPRSINTTQSPLKLKKLVLAEDIFCQSGFLYFLSNLVYNLINFLRLHSLRNNIIAVYKKS